MIDVNIMQDASEVIPYDNPKIPLYIQTRYLSTYPDMRALCHWHDEIEFIVNDINIFYLLFRYTLVK